MAKYIDVEALGIGIARAEIFANPEFARGWNNAIEIINNAPAADVTPVVHGRKIEDEGIGVFYLCSLCGECLPYGANYCPNCGAKMDKEEADDKKQPEEAPGE